MSTFCFPLLHFQKLKNWIPFEKTLQIRRPSSTRVCHYLLFYFSQVDSGVAQTIALQDTTVSLHCFIEQTESNALIVAQVTTQTQWGQVWTC